MPIFKIYTKIPLNNVEFYVYFITYLLLLLLLLFVNFVKN